MAGADDQSGPEKVGVFSDFSGLRNTVTPERMGSRELVRADNVNIDDGNQIRRRRGSQRLLDGQWHSVVTAGERLFGVRNNEFVRVSLDGGQYQPIVAGISDSPLCYVELAGKLYVNGWHDSFIVDLATLQCTPWAGSRSRFEYSPLVTNPEPGLPPIAPLILASPPHGNSMTEFNGRIYICSDKMLIATMLFLPLYYNVNDGYRYFEDELTGVIAVDDGLYVGTTKTLYFIKGAFGSDKRSVVAMETGVIPGTMIGAPAEIVSPEGRRRPDIPQATGLAMACMTTSGVVVGMSGGTAYNMTRTQFRFPQAIRGSSLFTDRDGMHTMVTSLDSGGGQRNTAAFGDYAEATIIRNGKQIQ